MLVNADPKQIDLVFNCLKKVHYETIFHEDIKPGNILLGVKIYILDAGHFYKDALATKKLSYDLRLYDKLFS
jgi:tRNA A-37 threonylcarbamoyl transferase component Bud32